MGIIFVKVSGKTIFKKIFTDSKRRDLASNSEKLNFSIFYIISKFIEWCSFLNKNPGP